MQILVAAPRVVHNGLPANTDGFGFETVDDRAGLLRRLRTAPLPDVVLTEFDLPGLPGLKGTKTVRALIADRPLGVFLPSVPLELARRLGAAGADALLPATIDAPSLLAAATLLTAGHRFVILSSDGHSLPSQLAEHLSERELQVLRGICDGLQNKEIAHAFGIQEVTVKMHVRGIIRKLGAHNRTHAAMIARDLGIV